MSFGEAYNKLKNTSLFKEWKEKNPDCYLAHFYVVLGNDFSLKNDWEIGFYDVKEDRIFVFVVGDGVELKPQEDVFKKEGKVEELELGKVKVELEKALDLFKEKKKEKYDSELLLNGFLILQKWEGKLMWNISFASKSMGILNIKIDAEKGEIISDQMVNFMEGKAS